MKMVKMADVAVVGVARLVAPNSVLVDRPAPNLAASSPVVSDPIASPHSVHERATLYLPWRIYCAAYDGSEAGRESPPREPRI
jgi:hypothetical protein